MLKLKKKKNPKNSTIEKDTGNPLEACSRHHSRYNAASTQRPAYSGPSHQWIYLLDRPRA